MEGLIEQLYLWVATLTSLAAAAWVAKRKLFADDESELGHQTADSSRAPLPAAAAQLPRGKTPGSSPLGPEHLEQLSKLRALKQLKDGWSISDSGAGVGAHERAARRPAPAAVATPASALGPHRPGTPGRLRSLSISHSASVLYGTFVWARRVLNSKKRRFLARAVEAAASIAGRLADNFQPPGEPNTQCQVRRAH